MEDSKLLRMPFVTPWKSMITASPHSICIKPSTKTLLEWNAPFQSYNLLLFLAKREKPLNVNPVSLPIFPSIGHANNKSLSLHRGQDHYSSSRIDFSRRRVEQVKGGYYWAFCRSQPRSTARKIREMIWAVE